MKCLICGKPILPTDKVVPVMTAYDLSFYFENSSTKEAIHVEHLLVWIRP
jgi:hypothetical protein